MNGAPGRSLGGFGPLDRWPWVTAGVAWLVGALVFFRDPVFSGFDTLTGDRGDARLIWLIHEHWWQVAQGDAPWRDLPIFHPTSDTLGYSDTFALNQLLYGPLRLVGVEGLLAFQLTLIGLTAIGFAASFAIMHRHLRLAALPACLLALVATFSNNLYVDTGHSQMYATAIVPVVALIGVESWVADRRGSRLALGAGCGLLLGLLVWSNFYIGWFAILLGGVMGLSAAVIVAAAGVARPVTAAVGARWDAIAAALVGFAAGLVPMLATYLPVSDSTQRRSYADVAWYATGPLDVVNVGRGNVVWGWMVRLVLGTGERVDLLHRAVALTPVLVTAVLCAAVGLALRWRRDGIATTVVIGLAAAATVAFAVVLPIQFPWGGLWAWVHRFVPGGSVIRVYGRIEVVNVLIACTAIGCWVSPLGRGGDGEQPRSRRREVLVLALLGLIAVEQLNTTTMWRRLDRSDELEMLAAVPEPMPECTSFFLIDTDRLPTDHSLIDAMLIAQRVGIPTVNGYSGQDPPGWNLRPWLDTYDADVEAWAQRHGIADGLCAYFANERYWWPIAWG